MRGRGSSQASLASSAATLRGARGPEVGAASLHYGAPRDGHIAAPRGGPREGRIAPW